MVFFSCAFMLKDRTQHPNLLICFCNPADKADYLQNVNGYKALKRECFLRMPLAQHLLHIDKRFVFCREQYHVVV